MNKYTVLLLMCCFAYCLAGCEDNDAPDSVKPTLTPVSAYVSGRTTATLTGTVSVGGNTQVEAVGFIYSKVSTLPDNETESTKVPITLSGSSGSYSINLTGLEPATHYYYCLYATCGKSSTRSEVKEFDTATDSAPAFGEITSSNLTESSVTLSCSMIDNGGYDATIGGFFYKVDAGDDSEPSLGDQSVSVSDPKSSTYSITLTGLLANTTYLVRAYGSNTRGIGYSETLELTTGAATRPVVSSTTQVLAQGTSITVSAQLIEEGTSDVTEVGFCWTADGTSISSKACKLEADGTSFGTTITGLSANIAYSIYAYATNAGGTSYGSTITYTPQAEVSAPVLSDVYASNVAHTSMHLEAEILSEGNVTVTEKGYCISRSADSYGTVYPVTNMGTGIIYDATWLSEGTTYYIWAYAINSIGTTYSDMLTVTTTILDPDMSDVSIRNITNTSAIVHASVGNEYADTESFGFEISTSELPDGEFATNSTIISASGWFLGYSYTLTDLTPNTTYYIRAWAKRTKVHEEDDDLIYTGFGATTQFTTLSNASSGAGIEDIPTQEW